MAIAHEGRLDHRFGHLEYVDLRPATAADDGPPMVFLHEGLGSVSLWKAFPGEAADATGRRTVVFSRHGYGASSVVEEPRTPEYMHHEAREVLPEVIEALGLHEPVLIGHSDGASIALIAAGEGTVAVSGLVLMAPHVIVEDISISGIAAAREAWSDSDLPERLARHHDDAASAFRGWNDIWLHPAFRDWDIREVLPAVTAPVLAIQGHDDEYGTMRQLDEIATAVGGPLDRLELHTCGHSPHRDRPEATLAAIVGFVRGLD